MSDPSKPEPQSTVGWREWARLPELGVAWLKCKVDTGARTSALHAADVEQFTRADGTAMVSFLVYPWQDSDADPVQITHPILEHRDIRSSNGEVTRRPVVRTTIMLGQTQIQADLTLARRDEMDFRMLLGRKAMSGAFLVNPARSYLQGRPPKGVVSHNRGREASP